MKNLLKNISFALISLALISLIFFGGFYAGKESSITEAPNTVNGTEATELIDADFSPFWETWNLLNSKFAPSDTDSVVSNQDRVWGAVSGMVDSLGDPYTKFLDPEDNSDFQTSISGEFSGVGMEIGIKDDILTVISPLKNTPAERAGVEPGDKIIAIDEENSIDMSSDEAASKIRGEIGTAVTLTVVREGVEEPFDIPITRALINIPTLDWEIQDDIFIISLYNFSANSAQDFRNVLRELIISKKNKLILDLRGNPGGFLDAAVDMTSWFLPAGKVIVREDFGDGNDKVMRSKGYNIFNDNLKMTVLIDGGSASASEILAGALQEYNIATLVGSQTFGKGSVQQLIDITDETSLKVTIAQWLTPYGKSISDGGLTPDIVIDEGENVAEEQMQKAIEILQ